MCSERVVFGVCCLLAAVLGGCVHGGERTVVSGAAALSFDGAGEELAFWEALRGQGLATNADVVRAAVLYLGEEGVADGLVGWREALESRGLMGVGGELEASASARVGLVAVLFGRIAGVEGVPRRAWEAGSLWETAAVKRGRAVGLLPERWANQAMTGAELIAVVRRAEMYAATGGTRLTGETGFGR